MAVPATPAATWELPLGQPPRVLRALGASFHGDHGVERYRLDGFWCLNLFHGEGELAIAGKRLPLRRGTATLTLPGHDHAYTFPAPLVQSLVHFQPRPGARTVPVPAAIDLGDGFAAAVADVALIARLRASEPERAEARLWDLLWRLAAGRGGEAGQAGDDDRLVEAVERLVRRNLAGDLPAGASARSLGLSPSQLNRRLVRAGAGPFSAVVRRLRMEMAAHLILRSDLPMAEIARRRGLGDAQRFNKAVRQSLGAAPRELRRSGGLVAG
jgi:AraC-like DNA-binding protein